MRITQSGGVVTATDTPGMHWLLGGFFVAVGSLFVAGTLGLADNIAAAPAGGRVFAGLAGVVAVAGGLHVIRGAPRVVAEFDTTAGGARVRLGRGAAESFPIAEIEAVELDQSKDTDGDPVYRAALRRRGTELVLLSTAWRHHGPRESAAELAALLGVPGPAAETARPGAGG